MQRHSGTEINETHLLNCSLLCGRCHGALDPSLGVCRTRVDGRVDEGGQDWGIEGEDGCGGQKKEDQQRSFAPEGAGHPPRRQGNEVKIVLVCSAVSFVCVEGWSGVRMGDRGQGDDGGIRNQSSSLASSPTALQGLIFDREASEAIATPWVSCDIEKELCYSYCAGKRHMEWGLRSTTRPCTHTHTWREVKTMSQDGI